MNELLFLALLYAARFTPIAIIYARPSLLRAIVLDVVDVALRELTSEGMSAKEAIKRFLEGDPSGIVKSLGYLRVAPRAFSLINSIDDRVYRKALRRLLKRYRYLHLIPLLIRSLIYIA